MKKYSLILVLILTSLSLANAQSQTDSIQTDSVQAKPNIEVKKVQWSAVWGLFGTAPKEKHIAFEFETSGFKEAFEPLENKIDTSKYEVKSYLWGAVKWTQKKK